VSELIRAVAYALTGIVCQQLEPITRQVFDRDPPYTLTKLVQHVEGGVMIIILFALAVIFDKRIPAAVKGIVIVHLVLAFFWSGGGVVMANIYASLTGRDRIGRE
jgi:hypothetical protein